MLARSGSVGQNLLAPFDTMSSNFSVDQNNASIAGKNVNFLGGLITQLFLTGGCCRHVSGYCLPHFLANWMSGTQIHRYSPQPQPLALAVAVGCGRVGDLSPLGSRSKNKVFERHGL